jgi:hypothetical protein
VEAAARGAGSCRTSARSLSLTHSVAEPAAEISSLMPLKKLRLCTAAFLIFRRWGALQLNPPSNRAPDPSGLSQLAFQRERESGRSAQSAGNGRGRDLIMQYAQVDAYFIISARLIALDCIVSSSLQVPK